MFTGVVPTRWLLTSLSEHTGLLHCSHPHTQRRLQIESATQCLPPVNAGEVPRPHPYSGWSRTPVSTTLLANTRHLPDAVLMLGRRRRRRASIKTTLGKCLMFAVLLSPTNLTNAICWPNGFMSASGADCGSFIETTLGQHLVFAGQSPQS